jgi:dehydrogenase/reductase SDR family protein 12
MLLRPVDTALDRLIAPGYTSVGYALRRRGWTPLPEGALTGRVALVTGAGSGIGLAATAGLAALGARVHLVVRDRRRGERAETEVAARVPGADLRLELCDVSDLAGVRAFAEQARERIGRPDVLVHNAGVLAERRTETDEGNELTLATHVLGPHLLTALLGAGRVIWVSSGGMYAQRLPADDLQYRAGEYRGATAYARAKRMQVVLAEEWARRLEPEGAVVHSMHPGWVDTPGLASSLSRFHRLTRPLLRTPEQGADTIVWLAAAAEPGRTTGRFWHDRRPRPTHYLPRTREDPADRAALWRACVELTGAP